MTMEWPRSRHVCQEKPVPTLGENAMTLAYQDVRLSSQAAADEAARPRNANPPPFKPVAMPALTAAVRAAYREPTRKASVDFPTLLRISAMLD
jgi:hypothetical protein